MFGISASAIFWCPGSHFPVTTKTKLILQLSVTFISNVTGLFRHSGWKATYVNDYSYFKAHTFWVENNGGWEQFSNIKTHKNWNLNACKMHLIRNRNTIKISKSCKMLFPLHCASLNKVTEQPGELLGSHIPAGTLKLGAISTWNCGPWPCLGTLIPSQSINKENKTNKEEWKWMAAHCTSKKSSSCNTLCFLLLKAPMTISTMGALKQDTTCQSLPGNQPWGPWD